MGWGHPAGRHLTDQANTAHQALTFAAEALDQAVLPGASLRGDAGRIGLVGNRIVADWWETTEPSAKARRPENEAQRGRPSMDRAVGR